MTESVVILGSTGSIGVSVLDVIRRHRDRYRVAGLSANQNVAVMARQCAEFRPDFAVMADPESAVKLAAEVRDNRTGSSTEIGADADAITAGNATEIAAGADAITDLAGNGADIIVCGIVGAAGLESTLAAVRGGGKILIANKEPLVMLGAQIMREARAAGATVIPIDSEHNAIFQCLPASAVSGVAGVAGVADAITSAADDGSADAITSADAVAGAAAGAVTGADAITGAANAGIARIWLTGSGGPFRELPRGDFATVTPAQACAHPVWDMGAKISVDSATMMNKGLELIEACALFGLGADDIQIVIHPQSVVHSMVEYLDGSIIAQLARPDMRVAIAYALGWPARIASGARPLNLAECGNLAFEAPDYDKFPALGLAQSAARAGGVLPTVMNAANEIAVAAFLAGELRFDRIPVVVEQVMNQAETAEADLESVLAADKNTRRIARRIIGEV